MVNEYIKSNKRDGNEKQLTHFICSMYICVNVGYYVRSTIEWNRRNIRIEHRLVMFDKNLFIYSFELEFNFKKVDAKLLWFYFLRPVPVGHAVRDLKKGHFTSLQGNISLPITKAYFKRNFSYCSQLSVCSSNRRISWERVHRFEGNLF